MSYFRAENLSLHFGGLRAVDAVSFAVEKGEILSIIGPNGAGKSSIFNLISRIYPPTTGKIFFEDQDITQEPAYDIAKLGIARTFQNIELFENATMMTFAFYADKAGKDLSGQKMMDALESGEKFLDIFSSPPTKFSKTDHLANTITQVQQVKNGRWVLVKEGLMF